MIRTLEGVYRNGKIELNESPRDVPDDTRVIVTFLEPTAVDLQDRGIDEALAAELRDRLATFAPEWDHPDMSLYDNYDVSKKKLETR